MIHRLFAKEKNVAGEKCDGFAADSGVPRSTGDIPRCLLLPHIHMSVLSDMIVFLDMKKNRYRCLSQSHLRALESALDGLGSGAAPANTAGELNALISALESNGLVTRDPTLGKRFCPITLPPIDITRSFDIPFRVPRIGSSDVMKFCLACISARLALWFRPLESIMRGLAKARSRSRRDTTETCSDAAEHVGALFRSLRCFFFSSRDKCLFTTLALTYFMRKYGQFPVFVIGIESRPFAPHCWAQHGQLAFDDRPERLGRYTRIAAIC
jgi:hypothetical protein